MVLRAPLGSGTGAAAQHSQSLEAWFAHVPGLKVVMPATAEDAKGLLLSAIDDPNPVHRARAQAALPHQRPGPRGRPTGPARQDRGTPLAARHHRSSPPASWSHEPLEAAETLAAEGIEPVVIDPRTLTPLDAAADPRRRRPHRTGAAGPGGTGTCRGFMAEIAARIVRVDLRSTTCSRRFAGCAGSTCPSRTRRSSSAPPYPQVEDIVEAARTLMKES